MAVYIGKLTSTNPDIVAKDELFVLMTKKETIEYGEEVSVITQLTDKGNHSKENPPKENPPKGNPPKENPPKENPPQEKKDTIYLKGKVTRTEQYIEIFRDEKKGYWFKGMVDGSHKIKTLEMWTDGHKPIGPVAELKIKIP